MPESVYNSSAFWNATRTNLNGRGGIESRYTYRGCIIDPVVEFDEVITETTTQGAVVEVQIFLNQKYNSNLVVDNIFGTKMVLVKAIYITLN